MQDDLLLLSSRLFIASCHATLIKHVCFAISLLFEQDDILLIISIECQSSCFTSH